jgi:Predicted transcriptional regulators
MMTNWVPQIDSRSGPIYEAIADDLAEAVADGRLRAGGRLPTHRDLAHRLGVTIGTVTRAYAEAERRGIVEATVGRGTFVKAPLASAGRHARSRFRNRGLAVQLPCARAFRGRLDGSL